MARPIDAYTLNNDLVSWYNDTEDETEKSILRRVMQRVVQAPTLTLPSNEPLTLEQLREMDGQPVFLVFMQPIEYGWEDQWALVDSENETVFNGAYKFDFSNCVGFAYRRPPEGEA
jgi:hypothetical protein